MFQAIIGLLAGMLVTGALFMGPLSPLPMLASPGENETDSAMDTSALSASITITEVLDRAAGGITNADIAGYYSKLVDSYRLDETSTGVGALPDIDNIIRQAVTLPFREAGNAIQDEEIAEFYQDFLLRTGLSDATD